MWFIFIPVHYCERAWRIALALGTFCISISKESSTETKGPLVYTIVEVKMSLFAFYLIFNQFFSIIVVVLFLSKSGRVFALVSEGFTNQELFVQHENENASKYI